MRNTCQLALFAWMVVILFLLAAPVAGRGDIAVLPPIVGMPMVTNSSCLLEFSKIQAAQGWPLRFAQNYRKAGGYLETLYIDNATKVSELSHNPTAAFFHRFLK